MTFKLDIKQIIEKIPLASYSGKTLMLSVPIATSGTVPFTADFGLRPHLSGNTWLIDLKVLRTPQIDLGAVAIAVGAEIANAPIELSMDGQTFEGLMRNGSYNNQAGCISVPPFRFVRINGGNGFYQASY